MKTKKIKVILFVEIIILFLLCILAVNYYFHHGPVEENEVVEEVPEEIPVEEEIVLSPEELLEIEINEYLDKMTLEEKVAQLFVVMPEDLVNVGCVVAAGEQTENAIQEIPVGGLIYFSQNLESAAQVIEMLSNTQAYMKERIGVPAFLCIDEEGGTVRRISGTGKFDVPDIGDMSDIGASGKSEEAYETGKQIGSYLNELGFNVDFAPVADVLTHSENNVVKKRSFGSDPEVVSEMAIAFADGLAENDVLSTYKHFPGHGATAGDTHLGYAYTMKSLEELEKCELIPFKNCIEKDAKMIMAAHISLPNVTQDNTPATLSKVIITDILRDKMGYDGIIITDAMNMGAVTEQYSSDKAAVKVIQAGADMILMPQDFKRTYQGVLKAVENKEISTERIDESVARILRVKLQMKE